MGVCPGLSRSGRKSLRLEQAGASLFIELPRGSLELTRRWVVERTLSWLSHNRRMSKDYERLRASVEVFVYAAMIRLMVSRLARST